jgi:SAM-dependent methyltransferase
MRDAPYLGGELELFEQAEHWKAYLATQLVPFLGARVLEVGAGIGGTTRVLARGAAGTWLCLEPDSAQARHLRELVERGELPSTCAARRGVVGDLEPALVFDTILYVDVLEHILEDAAELAAASRHLAEGGHLVVLSPAHPWLFSPFDAAIGHFRRYTRRTLRALAPEGLVLVQSRYLDSVGLLASAANRVALRQSMPTLREIRFWDRYLVRASRRIDGVLGFRVGKSLLCVWRRGS